MQKNTYKVFKISATETMSAQVSLSPSKHFFHNLSFPSAVLKIAFLSLSKNLNFDCAIDRL